MTENGGGSGISRNGGGSGISGEEVEKWTGPWSRWRVGLMNWIGGGMAWWNGRGGLLSPDRGEGGGVVGSRRLSHAAAG